MLGAVGQALAQVHGVQGAGRHAECGRAGVSRIADDLAVANLDDAVGSRRHFTVVGNQNDHMALARQFVEQGHDLGAAMAVEGAGGFVGEDDMAAVHQGAGDGHPLLLPTRQLVRPIAGALGQAQAGEQGAGAGMAFGGADAGIDRRHLDVFLGGA
ncbi:hypothetical protein PFLmoz3_00752 [Pseudomonas fluorescens]|uniref:Uncharacterized protein n=1 Tax=Pseudomonas fluorescens TaxID=294 RepID=A0A120G8Z6_PSEFL|nr:hypothetical protein PFLmoz3_00752 [Pseudomonas fluorescens]